LRISKPQRTPRGRRQSLVKTPSMWSQTATPSVPSMERYPAAARRHRWVILAILVVVWGAGLAAAYSEYTNTYEASATMWVYGPLIAGLFFARNARATTACSRGEE
jgi:hypothetical protein